MVSKGLDKLFTGVDKVATILSGNKKKDDAKKEEPEDITLCKEHKIKKLFYCEECQYILCAECKDWHQRKKEYKDHTVMLHTESAMSIIHRFKEGLTKITN